MRERKELTLGEVINLKRGYDLPNQDRSFGRFPIISSSGVMDFHSEYKVHGPGVVTGRYGTIGQVFYTHGDYWPLNTTLYVQDFKGNHPKFVYYLLKGFDFGKYSDKSAVPGVNRNDLHMESVTIPDLPEQKAIAEVLSSLDDKIDLLHRQNKTLESLAQTLFRQWFIEEADDSWEERKLGELFNIGIGRTPPRKEQHWFSTNPDDVKWISIKDMGNCGVYIDSTAEYLTAEAVEQFNVPIIPANTVLLSFKMTLGRLAITTERMLSNEAIAHFKQKENSTLFPEFLYLFLRTYKFELLGSTSSIVEAINSQMIKEMEMVVPDNAILGKFNESIRPMFSKIRENSIQIETLVRLRDSLLPRLMDGTLTTTN